MKRGEPGLPGSTVALPADRIGRGVPASIDRPALIERSRTSAAPMHRAWIEIDYAALAANTREIRRLVSPRSRLLAVVKADAYGHGAATTARVAIANGAELLGVATIEEGLELRTAGIAAPTIVLGYTPLDLDLIHAALRADLTLSVCSPEHARAVARHVAELRERGAGPDVPVPVHLKLDTGLSRLGHPWREAAEFALAFDELDSLLRPVGIYTHLACADDPDPASMREQQLRFGEALALLEARGRRPPLAHIANSAAVLSSPDHHLDLVRCGLALYGMYPALHLRTAARLTPLLSVRARITQTRCIPRGTSVSYGGQYIASESRRIATVAIGYADGIPCRLSSRLEVLVRGERAPQIGRIAMDQMMIDVTALPAAREGDVVTLIGADGLAEITVRDWAAHLGSIPWEVLCLFKPRLPRIAIGG